MKRFPTRRPPKQKLLVFARVPELGRVKTRLARELGAGRALAVYEAMLRDVLRSIGRSDGEIDIEVMWTGGEDVDRSALRHAFGDHAVSMQAGTTLGDRVAIAISERIFFHAAEKVIAIGTDDPALSRHDIEHAFDLLDCCDWVVGPAADGGYYLIGCRGEAFDSSVFLDIEWGSPSVFETTMRRIRALAENVATLPLRRDIDVPEDLRRYPPALLTGSALGAVLEEWGWIE